MTTVLCVYCVQYTNVDYAWYTQTSILDKHCAALLCSCAHLTYGHIFNTVYSSVYTVQCAPRKLLGPLTPLALGMWMYSAHCSTLYARLNVLHRVSIVPSAPFNLPCA